MSRETKIKIKAGIVVDYIIGLYYIGITKFHDISSTSPLSKITSVVTIIRECKHVDVGCWLAVRAALVVSP